MKPGLTQNKPLEGSEGEASKGRRLCPSKSSMGKEGGQCFRGYGGRRKSGVVRELGEKVETESDTGTRKKTNL